MPDTPSSHEVRCLWLLCLLSPAIRLLPGLCARLSGAALWLCPIAALPLIIALVFSLRGQSAPGRGLSLIFALWLAFYSGFTLRSAAERLCATAHPGGSVAVFALLMLAVALLFATGKPDALCRAAGLFLPVVALAVLLTGAFALSDSELSNLLPVTERDAIPVIRGALPVFEAAGFPALLAARYGGGLTRNKPRERRRALLSCLFAAALLLIITAGCTARFGAELAALLAQPYYALVSDTRLFGAIERTEALISSLWLLSDLVLAAMALRLSMRSLAGALRLGEVSLGVIAPCGAVAAAALLARSAEAVRSLGVGVILPVNLAILAMALIRRLYGALRGRR